MEEGHAEAVEELEVLDEGAARRPKGKMKERQRMTLTNMGLGFLYAKLVCLIASYALVGVFMIVGAFAQGSLMGSVVVHLSTAMKAITTLLGLTGALFCFWVPKRARARLLIQISFGLDAAAILLFTLSTLLILIGSPLIVIAASSLSLLATFASLGASILFLLFFRALAAYLNDRGSESEVMEIMVRWIVATLALPIIAGLVLGLTGLFPSPAGRGNGKIFGMVFRALLGASLLLSYLVFYFKIQFRLLNLIAVIRQKIASRYELD